MRKYASLLLILAALVSCTNPSLNSGVLGYGGSPIVREGFLSRVLHSNADTAALIARYNLQQPAAPSGSQGVQNLDELSVTNLPAPFYNRIAGTTFRGITRELTTTPVEKRNPLIFTGKYIKIISPDVSSVQADGYFRLQLVTTLKAIRIYLQDSNGMPVGSYQVAEPGYLDVHIPLYNYSGVGDTVIKVTISGHYPKASGDSINYNPTLPARTFEIHTTKDSQHEYLYPNWLIDSQSQTVVNKVREIVAGAVSEEQKVRKIFNWIRSNYVYDYDFQIGNPKASEIIHLDRRKLVCRNYSVLFAALCRSAGIKARYAVSVAEDNHAWNSVYLNGEWKWVDVTWNLLDFQLENYSNHRFDKFTMD